MGFFSSPAPAPAPEAVLVLPVTTAASAALGSLLIALSINIIKDRRSTKTSIGDGGNKALASKIRAHGNLTEYAPLVLIQLALVEASALLPRAALACVAALFVAARLLHASAMAYGGAFERRVTGTKGTFLSIAVLSSCCAVAAVKAVLP